MSGRSLRLAVLALVLCGCSTVEPDDSGLSRQDFLLHRALWQSRHFHNYAFDYDIQAMAMHPPVRIEVRADVVSRVVNRETGAELTSAGWPTIDGLFAKIEQELAEYKRYRELTAEWVDLSIALSRLKMTQWKQTRTAD